MWKSGKYFGGKEVDKCRSRLIKFCEGVGLDVGCGGKNPDGRYHEENKIHPLAIGCDLAQTNLVGKADNLYWFRDETLDYVFSSHLLEHMPDPGKTLKEWMRVLKPGGVIVMYLPLEDCYPNVGQPGANPDHKHNLTPRKVLDYLSPLSYEIVHIEEHTEGDEYSFDFVIRKKGVKK